MEKSPDSTDIDDNRIEGSLRTSQPAPKNLLYSLHDFLKITKSSSELTKNIFLNSGEVAFNRAGYLDERESSPDIAQEYEILGQETVSFIGKFDPVAATGECNPDFAGTLPTFTVEARLASLNELEVLENKLTGFKNKIQGENGSFEHHIGIANLLRRLETIRSKLEHPYQLNLPTKYTAGILLENFIYLLREGLGTPEEVRSFLLRNLLAIPSFLREAAFHLSNGPIYKTSLEAAKEHIPEIMAILDTDVAKRIGEEEKTALQAARIAVKDFGDFLNSIPPALISETGGFAVGAEKFKEIYSLERGLGDMDPSEMIAMGKSEVAKLKGEILDLKIKISQELSIDPALSMQEFAKALQPHLHFAPDKEGLLTNVRKTCDVTNEFFTREHHNVPVHLCKIDVANALPFLQQNGFMVFWPNMFKREAENPRALYMVGADVLDTQTNPMCSLEALIVFACHEVNPGHINHASFIKQHSDIGRRTGSTLSAVGMIEGWGLFSEEIAMEAGFFDYAASELGLRSDLINLFYLKTRLLRAGRMVVDPALQTEAMNQSEVEKYLVEECLQDSAFAKGQADYYPMMPGYPSSYYPGYLQLKALRDLTAEIFSGAMPKEQAHYWFYKTFLSKCGFMSMDLVTFYVLVKAFQERKKAAASNYR